jgi:hypothetical protein
MLTDLEQVRDDIVRESEICVIGAGAAGLTIARRLLAKGHGLILLESGGRDYEAATAGLNAGENVGEDYYPLDHARLRFFGGTTAIWGGRCAELDPVDLETRPWVPESGWPLSHAELEAYYRQARPLFDLGDGHPDIAILRDAGVPIPAFDPERLALPVWAFDMRFGRFAFDSCDDLVDHPRCEVVLHATVTSIHAGASGEAVQSVWIGMDADRRIGVMEVLQLRNRNGGPKLPPGRSGNAIGHRQAGA